MKTDPIRCALYTRVSSRGQAERDYSSLETQRERLEAYCRSQEGFTIHRVYEDGAFSGENTNRPALQSMLADIRAGLIDCVLAYKIDRLTRSVKDFHLLMHVFDQHGVKFVSITQSLDTSHPMGRLLRNILLDFAQFERDMISDRTRDKMNARAAKGMWNGGVVPYGYRSEAKRLVPHETEAPRVRQMYEWFAEEPSLAVLRNHLKRLGWHTRAGNPWTKSALSNVLKNPVYLGLISYGDTSCEGLHEGLVEEALFRRVQLLQPHRQHAVCGIKRPFLLKGLLHCSDCGSRMTPHYVQKRRKDGSINRIAYYRCTRTMKYDNRVCRIKHLNADRAEATILENLRSLSQNEAALEATISHLNSDLRTKVAPLEKELRTTKKRLGELEAEIDRFVQALGKGRISVDRLEREMERRQADQKLLGKRCEELQGRINEEAAQDFNAELVKRNLRDFRTVFDALEPSEKGEALQCLLKQITVSPDKLVMEIYELADFAGGSTNRSEWYPG